MTKTNLKAVHDPARAELASAIEEAAKIEERFNARRATLDRASALVSAALDRREKARAEAITAKENLREQLVAAAISGAPVAQDSSIRDAHLKEAEAEDELAAAKSALETIQQSADPFDNSLELAQARVQKLAATIMSGAIDRITHEADELTEALFERRLALRAIMSRLDRQHQRDAHNRINDYLSAPIFPLQMNHAAVENHPVTRNWQLAHDDLTRNAHAELPRG